MRSDETVNSNIVGLINEDQNAINNKRKLDLKIEIDTIEAERLD